MFWPGTGSATSSQSSLTERLYRKARAGGEEGDGVGVGFPSNWIGVRGGRGALGVEWDSLLSDGIGWSGAGPCAGAVIATWSAD